MPVVTCFWSLLSLQNFEFLYIPSVVGRRKILNTNKSLEDILLHHSLYEFMHPSEIELAKSDLANFLNLRILAGSVTRCRLLSLEDIACRASGLQSPSGLKQGAMVSKHHNGDLPNHEVHKMWTTVDIVIYTATHELVLAFFHNIDFGPLCMNDKVARRDDEYSHSNFANQDTLNMVQAVETVKRFSRMNDIGRMNDDFMLPKRFFQITDHLTQNVAFSWPAVNPSNSEEPLQDLIRTISKDIAVKEFRNSSYNSTCRLITAAPSSSPRHNENEEISCTRHFYASVNVELFDRMYNFHKILIPYGTITFETIQVTPLDEASSPQCQAQSPPGQVRPVQPQQRPNQISLPPLSALYRGSEDFRGSNIRTKQMAEDHHHHQVLPLSAQILISNPLTKSQTDHNLNNDLNQYPSAGSRISNEDYFSSEPAAHNLDQPYHLLHSHSASSSPYYGEPTAAAASSSASLTPYSPQNRHYSMQQQQQQYQQHAQQRLPRIEIREHLFPSYSTERRRRYQNKRQQTSNNSRTSSGESVKVCTRCLTSQSPEWRRGPDGHKTLCNACGLRYSRLRSKQWRAALAAREASN